MERFAAMVVGHRATSTPMVGEEEVKVEKKGNEGGGGG
jgi:hypothetical protein